MCGTCFGHGVLAAIFAAIFGVLFFNGLWLQFAWAGKWGTTADIGMLFVQYAVAFFFLGAAKMVMWKGMEKHKAAGGKKK